MTGQVPSIGNFGLIDKDTPSNAYRKTSYVDGSTYELVFSDEFNTDGRSFYPGGKYRLLVYNPLPLPLSSAI